MEIGEAKNGRMSISMSRQYTLSMYDNPPDERVSVSEFELAALDRLALLNSLVNIEGFANELSEVTIRQMIRECNLDDSYRDCLSHFTLRLALSHNEESRRWFARAEAALFKHRFSGADRNERGIFLKENGFDVTLIPMDESLILNRKDLHDELFKIPFENALELVGKRKVTVQSGFAFVPAREIVSIVVSKFRTVLSENLSATFRASYRLGMHFDVRIQHLLKALQENLVSDRKFNFSQTGTVHAQQIEQLAHESFPLCMLNLYKALKHDHHLKHDGRRQLTLFLKGIGLSLEDALTFWRQCFAPRITGDKFEKQYAYGVRYEYGKEGKRVDWRPMGCSKILNGPSPGTGQYHGCPFKHCDKTQLQQKLASVKFSANSLVSMKDIVDKATEGHYQVACQKMFQAMHPTVVLQDVGNHPNAYFSESRKFWDEFHMIQQKE